MRAQRRQSLPVVINCRLITWLIKLFSFSVLQLDQNVDSPRGLGWIGSASRWIGSWKLDPRTTLCENCLHVFSQTQSGATFWRAPNYCLWQIQADFRKNKNVFGNNGIRWSFRQNRNNGNTGEPSGNRCLGLIIGDAFADAREYYPRKIFRDFICKILQSSAFLAGKWFAMPPVAHVLLIRVRC